MSQQLIEEELMDPLPTLMPKWTALMRYATENTIQIIDEKYHSLTPEGKSLQNQFEVNYENNFSRGCLATEALGGFKSNGYKPYNTNCCGDFPYGKAIKALRSWNNFIAYKKEFYNHIIESHPDVEI